MNDKDLDAYCEEWKMWCATRKYYLQPGAQNILARMQPSKLRQPPNARNAPDMQYFNMAIHAMADMKENEATFACFKLTYIEQPASIKQAVAKLGIGRATFYRRAIAFSRKAYSMAASLKAAYKTMSECDLAAID